MSVDAFRNKIRDYRVPTGRSQKELAQELGLHPVVLSNKLNGTNSASLNHAEVKKIVQILAEWGAISSQLEAVELLEMMNLKFSSFTPAEWNKPPLSRLEVMSGKDFARRESQQSGPATAITPLPAAISRPDALPTVEIPNNLPFHLSSFIGRERELEKVKRLLLGTRLLTITGTGGTGKTRLALQAATELLTEFPAGVWLVELAPVSDPAMLEEAIAKGIGLRENSEAASFASLTEYIKTKNMLFILDNCEHLVDRCAQLAGGLLRNCPNLRILAVTREALGLAGESYFLVPSLSLPTRPELLDEEDEISLEKLVESEAVRLFTERANAAEPEFKLTNQNAPAIAQICRQLEGIPLALELAAARVKVLKVEEIAARLANTFGGRFQLLVGGSRTALPRHQTLQALFDWSYDLLTEDERGLLRRLSVFAGGWTLEAAEAIAGDGGEFMEEAATASPTLAFIPSYEVLNLLTQLVNKSMVVVENRAESTRYHLLETVRQYARQKLQQAGESEVLHQRHLNYFLRLAEQAGLEPAESIGWSGWVKWLEIERDNLRAALEWVRAKNATGKYPPEVALRLASVIN